MKSWLNVVLWWLVAWPAWALSLGEGHILSRVGEPFSARIELQGGFDPSVKFYQVKAAECRAVLSDCEALYEGMLSLSTWRRPDGQYVIKLSGDRRDDMFYRVILKAVTSTGDASFKSYEFLPEFKPDAAVSEEEPRDVVVDSGAQAGKLGLVKREEAETAVPVKPRKREKTRVEPVAEPAHKLPSPEPLAAKAPRLQISHSGEFSDDIHALKHENVAIEAQIALLERQIGLLKEVIRLKEQAGPSAVAEAAVMADKPAAAPKKTSAVPLTAPVPVTVTEPGWLTGLLLALAAGLLAVIALMYAKMKQLRRGVSGENTASLPAATMNEMKSLDLTGVFVKPKW